MNLDIINQINQSVHEDTKEVKAEELKDKESVLEKNHQTTEKIEQERAILSSTSSSGEAFGLNKPKEKQESFFKKSGSSLDSLFETVSNKEPEKKTTGYTYGYYNQNQSQKKEETKQDKIKEFSTNFTKRAAQRAYKEWQSEAEKEENSWSIFELQEKAEDKRRSTRRLSKDDKRKLRNKDIFIKSVLMGIISAGKEIIAQIYATDIKEIVDEHKEKDHKYF